MAQADGGRYERSGSAATDEDCANAARSRESFRLQSWTVVHFGRVASGGDRLVLQKEDLVPLEFSEGKGVPGWIKKLHLKHVRGKDFDDGADMASGQALCRLVHEQRHNIQEFDRFWSHQADS